MPTAQQNYPVLAPASVGTGTVTLSALVNSPTRLIREVNDYLLLSRFFAAGILRGGPKVEGGAVIFDKVEAGDPFGDIAERDVQEIAPGSKFPIVGGTRKDPSVELVKKYGGKIFATYEEIERNSLAMFRRREQQLANRLALTIETVSITKINAEIAAARGAATTVPTWKPSGDPTTLGQGVEPIAGILKAQAQADTEDLGVVLDTLIAHPLDLVNLRIFYGDSWKDALDFAGISNVLSTNRQAQNSGLLLQSGQIGALLYEKGHYVDTWDDKDEEVKWVKHGAIPAVAIDNPMAGIQITGTNA